MTKRRVAGTTDAAPRALYAKITATDEYCYPVFITTDGSLNVNVAEDFDIPIYDTVDLTWSGTNVTTILFSKNAATVATLNLSYTGANVTKIEKT